MEETSLFWGETNPPPFEITCNSHGRKILKIIRYRVHFDAKLQFEEKNLRKSRIYGSQRDKIYNSEASLEGRGQLVYDLAERRLCTVSYYTAAFYDNTLQILVTFLIPTSHLRHRKLFRVTFNPVWFT